MDPAPTAGCLDLKIVRYVVVTQALNGRRLLRARDPLRRRLLKCGRSRGGGGGVEDSPFSFDAHSAVDKAQWSCY